jgi:hypothetical protein
MPQFILDTCATAVETESGTVYFFSTVDRDGWVVYWPQDGETLHTYRNPQDWLV